MVWLVLFILDSWKNIPLVSENIYPFIGGVVTGLLIGVLLGLKNRRDILRASDELLSQIEDLRNN